jgi:hypothetical protein
MTTKEKTPVKNNKKKDELAAPAAEVVAITKSIPRSGPIEGFELMTQEDVTQPRLMLAQSMTPQRKKEDPKYIKGLEEGMFFNSVTGEIYGPKVKISPVMFFKQNILLGDIDEGGGLLCRAVDGKHGVGEPGGVCTQCPKQQWLNNEPPECTLLHNYAALIIPANGQVSFDCLVVVSMKSTNLKLARDWNSLMRLRQGEDRQPLPMWRGIYELESQSRSEGKYSWYVAVPKNAGVHKEGSPAGEACRAGYLMVREMYAQGRLAVEPEVLTREPGEDEI